MLYFLSKVSLFTVQLSCHSFFLFSESTPSRNTLQIVFLFFFSRKEGGVPDPPMFVRTCQDYHSSRKEIKSQSRGMNYTIMASVNISSTYVCYVYLAKLFNWYRDARPKKRKRAPPMRVTVFCSKRCERLSNKIKYSIKAYPLGWKSLRRGTVHQ